MSRKSRAKARRPAEASPAGSPAPTAAAQVGKQAEKPGGAVPLWRRDRAWLALILLLAAVLRVANLGESPPGLNQDEATNGWNAYCLLKAGKDQVGASWPIFSSRCLGENRTTLYIYYLIPFLGAGGLNVWTMRFASAFGGIATVLLTYYVGRRLFNRWVGILGAGLLAVTPWALEQSRWAHESAIVPLLVVGPLAMMLWANLPLSDVASRPPRPVLAALAGLVVGLACYGYPAVKLFLPVFLTLGVLVTWRAWWNLLKTRRGILAFAGFCVGVAVTFGPLAWKHLTDPGMTKRGKTTAVWDPQDSFGTKVGKALERYPGHFGPEFLFEKGDRYPVNHVPGWGLFHWYMLPLMVLGLVAAAPGARRSLAARILLVWLIVYPVGDCLSTHGVRNEQTGAFEPCLHALRSLPGLPVLVLLAAVGTVSAAQWLLKRNRSTAYAAGTALAIAVVALNVAYLSFFYGDYNRRPEIYRGFQVAMLEAGTKLRQRLKDADAVFCTAVPPVNQPYIVSLVALSYDPKDWFAGPHVVFTDEPGAWSSVAGTEAYKNPEEWDYHVRYGKMNFLYCGRRLVRTPDQREHVVLLPWAPVLAELDKIRPQDRVVFIIQPGENAVTIRQRENQLVEALPRLAEPFDRVKDPQGQDVLWMCEMAGQGASQPAPERSP